MTGIAIESFVPTIQSECGPSIVIKVPQLPVSQTVAVLALRPQLAPVHILALMARVAARRRLVLIEGAGVTTLAGCGPMLAEEGVFGIVIMVEGDGFPGVLAVALVAGITKVRPVNVIFLVAANAVGRGLVFIEDAGMAAVTFRFPVVAPLKIAGIPIVIKEQYPPVTLRVAAFTAVTIAPLVLVVFLVAGAAVDLGLVVV